MTIYDDELRIATPHAKKEANRWHRKRKKVKGLLF